MREFFKKLKSQRGATGTDILISASIIVISIGVVSLMYLNTSIQSRNITRTAGATRIATNLIENVDAMSYDEFISVYGPNSDVTQIGDAGVTFLDTKIPKGFILEMKATPVYGSHTVATEQYDLVRQIEVKVSYNVGGKTENVKFSTVKQRELLKECNEPAMGDLRNQLQATMKYYPVKYLQSSNVYIKTIEDDVEWYNYTTKKWAIVIVSKLEESALFDVNGKFVGTINTNTANANYTQKFVWVPRYFANSSSDALSSITVTSFAFRNSDSQKIANATLQSVANTATSNFNYYKAVAKEAADSNRSEWGTATGIWSGVNADNTLISELAKRLNASVTYGPCNIH